MEKIRKTLMVQLEALQRDIAPKDRELSKTTDKMQELVREYEVALAAIAEKEKTLEHKTQNLLLLQKQVRELRSSNAQKDSALSRAATLLSEFLFAMQEARFQPRKSAAIQQKEIFLEQRAQAIAAAHNSIINSNSNNKNNKTKRLDDNDHNEIGVVNNNNVANPNNNNNSNTSNKSESKKKNTVSASDPHYVVSSLHLDTSADLKLRSLHDVLKNFMSDTTKDAEIVDEIESVRREQERHVVLLHRNIQSLKNSLDSSQQLAQTKLQNHLQDNEVLLKEVNALRCEVKALSLENHRLQATLDFRQTNNVVNSNKGFQMISGDLDSSNNNSNLSTSRDIDRDNRERDGRRIHSRNHSRAGSKHGTQLIGVALQDSLAQQLLQSNDSVPRASISAGDVAKQALPPLQALPHLYSAVNGEPNGWEESQTLSLPRLSAPSAGLQFPPPQLHNSHNSIPLQSSSANLHMGITQNPHMSHLSHSQSHSRGPSVLEVEVPTSLNSHHNHMKGLSYSKSQQSVSQSQSFVLQQQSRSIASLDSHEPSSFAMDVTGASLLHKQGGVSSAEDKINAIMQMNLAEIRSNPTTQQASQPQTQQKQAAQNRPKANIKSSSAKQVAANKAATSYM